MTLPTPVARSVRARTTFTGYHRWPEASGERTYLADRHRHEFTLTAELRVDHQDREVEFHDLADFLAVTVVPVLGDDLQPFAGAPIELGRRSCEDVAEAAAAIVEEQWPGRVLWVEVSEDDQVHARLTYRIPYAQFAKSDEAAG